MRDYEWQSTDALRGEVIIKALAFSSLIFVPAIWLFVLDITLPGIILLLLATLLAVFILYKSRGTKISVKGNTFYFGVSHKADLSNLKSVTITKQFGIEDVIVFEGTKGRSPIPISGVPKEVRSELLEVINERIKPS